MNFMSGRALFEFNPDLFNEDDDADNVADLEEIDSDEEEETKGGAAQ